MKLFPTSASTNSAAANNASSSSPGALSATPLPRAWAAISTIMKLELTGRARSKKWVAAMIVWIVVLVLMWLGFLSLTGSFGVVLTEPSRAKEIFAIPYVAILMFTLAISLLMAPLLSATSINGDRDTANLAILQATPITPGQLLWGKLLASWIGGTVFILVAAIPLTAITLIYSLGWLTLIKAVIFLVLEVFVFSAIGLGFSALFARPVLSVLMSLLSLLLISALSPLSFLFAAPALTETGKYPYMSAQLSEAYLHQQKQEDMAYREPQDADYSCVRQDYEFEVFHSERAWGLLAVSPFLLMPDFVAGAQAKQSLVAAQQQNPNGSSYPSDFLSKISEELAQARAGEGTVAARIAQMTTVTPPRISRSDECYYDENHQLVMLTAREHPYGHRFDGADYQQYLGTSWVFGMGLHILLATGALGITWMRLRTPVKRLPRGIRIA